MNQSNSAKNRRFKFGFSATVFTALFVAIVILLNILASVLEAKFPLELDLTQTRAYSLSDQAKEYIKNVNSKVNIYVIGNEDSFSYGEYSYYNIPSTTEFDQYFASINEILKSLPKMNSNIGLKYINKLTEPTFFQNYKEELKDGQILVQNMDDPSRYKILEDYNYLTIINDSTNPNYSSYVQRGIYLQKVVGSNLENAVCSALVGVTSGDIPTVTFLTGHNEDSLEQFTALLEHNNYTVDSCYIPTENISPDTDFLIIAGPNRDYSEADLKKIDAYLAEGKSLMVFFNPTVGKLPTLEAFLAEWGIGVEEGMLAETAENKYYQNQTFLLANYGSEEYTHGLNAYPLVPMSRSITQLSTAQNGVNTSVVVKTSDSAALLPADIINNPKLGIESAEKKGEFNAIVSAKKVINANPDEYKEANVVVCGSMYFVFDEIEPLNFLSNPTFSNAELSLNIINQSTGTESLNLITKVIDPSAITILISTAKNIGWSFMYGVPVVLLIIAGFIWWRRKNR